MSTTATPTLYDAARLARRAVVERWGGRVPRLRFDASLTAAPPTAWIVCPDFDEPSGGVRTLYRVSDSLNDAGLPAAIVHKRSGFSCSWFAHSTRTVAAADIAIGPHDVVVVPELYGPSIGDLPTGVRQVILNQGVYLMLDSLGRRADAAAPYVDNPDLVAVIVVSNDSAEVLGHVFPGMPIRRMHLGIDPAVYYPPALQPHRRIAYMPRRRTAEAAQVLRILELRGVLDTWDVVAIDGRRQDEVADLLRSSSIFLSFSEREGFGLPACEALACGCLVVGFDGFGGREFFRRPFAEAIPDGDVVAFARATEQLARRFDTDRAATVAAAEDGARFVAEHYSPAIEQRDLVDIFGSLLRS